ncbi:MAG: RdgB/HAM1 family non-canonical purine NTP pyrophosphatase [Candidatus Aenigmatarchaeota archaeon]
MVTIVTSNEGKFREFKSILDVPLKRKNLDLEEIQSVDVGRVVKHKLKQAYEILGEPVIVEDTGLFIEDLNGLPGALVRFFLERMGNEGICSIVGDNKKAYAETCIGYMNSKDERMFKGRLEGKIVEEPRGNKGFGWGPTFLPKGERLTFGQMEKEKKNSISMRKKAIKKLEKYLNLREDNKA